MRYEMLNIVSYLFRCVSSDVREEVHGGSTIRPYTSITLRLVALFNRANWPARHISNLGFKQTRFSRPCRYASRSTRDRTQVIAGMHHPTPKLFASTSALKNDQCVARLHISQLIVNGAVQKDLPVAH